MDRVINALSGLKRYITLNIVTATNSSVPPAFHAKPIKSTRVLFAQQ